MIESNNIPCTHEHPVKISLNNEKIKINSGTYLVSNLRILLEIPTDYEFERVVDGEFIPLNDIDQISICGKEEFVSHVKCGGSS